MEHIKPLLAKREAIENEIDTIMKDLKAVCFCGALRAFSVPFTIVKCGQFDLLRRSIPTLTLI